MPQVVQWDREVGEVIGRRFWLDQYVISAIEASKISSRSAGSTLVTWSLSGDLPLKQAASQATA